MMSFQKLPLILSLSALPLLASAETDAKSKFRFIHEAYIGIGPMGWYYDDDSLPSSTATGGRLSAGVLITDRIGVELHLGMIGENRLTEERVTVELDTVDSVLLRLNGPAFPGLNFHALAGFSTAQIIITPEEVEGSAESASGLSFGLGMEFRPGDRYAVTVDYVRYLSEPDFVFQAVTGTFKWRY
ncbi:MAG: outer membrane beta-barrel protein [Oleiphilaceae bacterium]|nr:outer membrane beta-barrel protein [Oleiphilaceae bacterium]